MEKIRKLPEKHSRNQGCHQVAQRKAQNLTIWQSQDRPSSTQSKRSPTRSTYTSRRTLRKSSRQWRVRDNRSSVIKGQLSSCRAPERLSSQDITLLSTRTIIQISTIYSRIRGRKRRRRMGCRRRRGRRRSSRS